MKKKLLSMILLFAMLLAFSACKDGEKESDKSAKMLTQDSKGLLSGLYGAEIEIENYGTIKLTLDADNAPVTVTNFVNLANADFYDGLTFHRIMDGFMMQGGDPEGTGMGGSKQNIQGEFAANSIKNNLAHTRGVISMARTDDPNSASSQFFIVHEDSNFLDGNYAAFGWVTEGMDIVDTICTSTKVEDGNGTVLKKNQPVIKEVRITGKLKGNTLTSGNTTPTSVPTQSTTLLTRDSEGLLSGQYGAEIEIEKHGTITLTLDADIAPVTVTNFVNLANADFYDGLTFHRIMDGFMMQGGDPEGTGIGGSAQNIQGEFATNGITNTLTHSRGVISMARANEPNSASSQFFIVHEDSIFLNGNYAAFGWVTEGMDIVDTICTSTKVEDGNGTVLKKNQPVIKDIRITGKIAESTSTTGAPSLSEKDMLTLNSEGLLSGKHKIEIEFEEYGTVALTLDADIAPVTVTNFIHLVKDGFYNGLTLHRIISGFMIQGGDPLGNGIGGSDRNIQGEFVANGIVNNLAHTRGVISMARSSDPNSASSQFFIMHQDAPHLDGSYAAFGQVTSGMEVVDAICENTPIQDSNGTVAATDQPRIKEIRIIK